MSNPAPQIWFVTGSQHLYGPATLAEVAANTATIVAGLNASGALPMTVVAKPVMTDSDGIRQLSLAASADTTCAGLVFWNHTFSPAKMWIGGLTNLRKPFVHLHTQFNRDLPWATIDMDFMNTNQAAHGDREGGFIHTRMRLDRKVVVGHWQNPQVVQQLGAWVRAAAGWHDLQGAKFVRFGDNMRNVAVTDGDKVAAEIRFGTSILSHGVTELVDRVAAQSDKAVDALIAEYEASYVLAANAQKGGAKYANLREQARIELGLRSFLVDGGFKGFTTNFEDLGGLTQLPGLAVQRLMADGYGFGAEGDWKTCFLLRAAKTMAKGLAGGTSWMEDYTYHLEPGNELVLGSHMLEVCPTIAAKKPELQIHPLGIGGKADPARLVFAAKAGPSINASLVDLGNRFRLIVNELETVTPPAALPNLPVAHAVWKPLPDFASAAAAWIYAGGAHHSAYTQALTTEHFRDFATIAGIELVTIGRDTKLEQLRQELRWSEISYHLGQGLGRM